MSLIATLDVQKLPRDVDALHGIIGQLRDEYATVIESLRQQLLTLRRIHFGASSERMVGQSELFEETSELPVPPRDEITVQYQRARRGRPSLPKDLPRERVEYDLTPAEKAEFERLERIGEEVSETLEYTPAKLLVREHARLKYACTKDGDTTVRTAFAQPSPLPKSNAGAGLLAQIVVATYADHLPLHRQERIFLRHGVELPRSTLCEWKCATAELLSILLPPLQAHIRQAPRIHCDDTTLPLLDPGRGHTKTARLWGFLGAGPKQNEAGQWVDHPAAVMFTFATTREGKHAAEFLGDYQGYLQADAFSGFDALYAKGRVVEVGCFAHCRRKFYEVAKAATTPGLAADAVAWIRQLYKIEARLRGRPPDQIHEARQEEAVPILDKFHKWLQGHAPTVLPESPLGKAFAYALNQWSALRRYTEDGVLVLDNNPIEAAIRPIALGRKAYLFAAAERGGKAAATLYSLLGTCKLHGVEPYAYLKDVLERLAQHPVNRLAELLPFNWQPAGR